jgi:hypothetical protein
MKTNRGGRQAGGRAAIAFSTWMKKTRERDDERWVKKT